MSAWWAWIETTALALTVRDSLLLTAWLSAAHVIGLTLVGGGALVSALRLLGWLFQEYPLPDVTGAARRGITLGLVISVTTGALLFSTRASAAAANPIFRIKMLLLFIAAIYHVGFFRPLTLRTDGGRLTLRLHGVLTCLLWFGVAAAGCAFILLE